MNFENPNELAAEIIQHDKKFAKQVLRSLKASLEFTPNTSLTRKQQELLSFVREYVEESGGVAPSFDEMKDAVGLRSKSGVHRLMKALEERGHIRRLYARARAIEVLS